MKKLVAFLFVGCVLVGCAPEVGSPEWCAEMKEKPKEDWTTNEGTNFAKHCIF